MRAWVAAVAVVLASTGMARADYIRDVADAIRPRWREVYRGTSEGTVVVRVVVTPHGAVRDVVIDQSSGVAELDAAALEVFRGSHLPPPPVGANEVEFLFPITVTGWTPPPYAGDASGAVRDPRKTDAGLRFELVEQGRGDARLRSESIVLSGTQHVYRSRIADYAIGVEVPYRVLRYRDAATATSIDKDGIGDVSISAIANERVFGRWRFDIRIGLTLPSGDDAIAPIDTADIQLGTGKAGLVTEGCFGPVSPRHVIQVCSSLDAARSPTMSYSLRYTQLLVGRRVAAHASALYADHYAPEAFLDDHHTLFAEAGVWASVYRGLVVQASFAQRVVETTSDGQLGDRLRFSAMINYDFARP